MPDLTIGFIGFGEAASCFARHLSGQSGTKLRVFCNGRTNKPPYTEPFRRAVESAGAVTVDTLAELCAASDVVIAAVLVANALEVAQEAAPWLSEGALYVDISASIPSKKKQLAAEIEATGARFVDANLMGSVEIFGPQVTLYCSGSGASQFAAGFLPLGLTVEVASDQAGDAAMVKMLRSVVTKGIEAIVVEALTLATIHGVRGELLRGLFETMDSSKFSTFVDMCVRTDVLHSERRAVEMDEIAADIRAMGHDPIMAAAAGRRLWASTSLDLRDAFVARGQVSLEDVLDAYAAAMRAPADAPADLTLQQE